MWKSLISGLLRRWLVMETEEEDEKVVNTVWRVVDSAGIYAWKFLLIFATTMLMCHGDLKLGQFHFDVNQILLFIFFKLFFLYTCYLLIMVNRLTLYYQGKFWENPILKCDFIDVLASIQCGWQDALVLILLRTYKFIVKSGYWKVR